MSEAGGPPAAVPALTPEEYAALKEQAQRAQDYWDRLLRLQAEFENTRKRMRQEQLEHERRAAERLLAELLGIVDDFERALAAAGEDPGHFRTGVEMIYRHLVDLLKAHGVEPIRAVGEPFDPAQHEAVAHCETADHPEATVVEELRKGYLMHGRVLRPASVKVAVKPTSQDEGGT